MKMNQKQHHTDQFMEYYEKYHDDIFRFVMVKTRDRALSLDITQETFMKFWEYIIKDKEIEQERPLLYRIANNLIIDSYRKKKDVLVEDFTDGAYEHYVHSDDTERQTDKLDGEKLITLLHELPELTREIITLRFINDFSISEIAQTINRDNKTVSVYLHRGMKQLREIVEKYER
jgi:RNA polymerase sigma-70 factor (ECF subfamily)